MKSLNVPSVKIIEDISVDWASQYAKRLGIFSQLNPDFTLVLGSSSVTLYEMTKVFSQFGRMGKRTRPIIVHKVEDNKGKNLVGELTLDLRYNKELDPIEKQFEEKRTNYLATKTQPTENVENPVGNDGKKRIKNINWMRISFLTIQVS